MKFERQNELFQLNSGNKHQQTRWQLQKRRRARQLRCIIVEKEYILKGWIKTSIALLSIFSEVTFPIYLERCSSVRESEGEANMSDLSSGKPDLGGEREHWNCLG